MIGSKFSRHFFNQSEVKPKPIVARACTFSRLLCRLLVITASFDWFAGLSPTFLIGQSNYFGFGFTALDWNSLYSAPIIERCSRALYNTNLTSLVYNKYYIKYEWSNHYSNKVVYSIRQWKKNTRFSYNDGSMYSKFSTFRPKFGKCPEVVWPAL